PRLCRRSRCGAAPGRDRADAPHGQVDRRRAVQPGAGHPVVDRQEQRMTEIADTVEDLTADWFTSALREGGTIGFDVSVTSANSELGGTGQLGLVVQTDLEYDSPDGLPPSLVTKLPSRDAGSRQLGAMMGVYEAEVRFYQEIVPLVDAEIPAVHWGDIE